MARYFLDTGVIVGYTFLHDMWQTEAEEVLEPDNTLYLDQVVLFEYCNNIKGNGDDAGNSLQDEDIDWETDEGKYGEILGLLEGIEPIFDLTIDSYDKDDLTIEAVIEEFISLADIDDDVEDEKIKKYVRPTLREFIVDELDGREATAENLRDVTRGMVGKMIKEARERREELKERMKYRVVSEEERE